MSHIAIAKVHDGQSEAQGFFAEWKTLTDRIRDRAFALFQKRGSAEGDAITDWLQAEGDLTFSTRSDLVEKDSGFQLSVAVPGFSEKDLRVTALPDALVVKAESAHHHEKKDGNVCFCEFSDRQIFRRFALPKAIDVDKVTAQLDKGILRVTAAKAKIPETASVAA